MLANVASPVERATRLLRFCTGGYTTEGQLAARAWAGDRALSRPGFLTGYAARSGHDAEVAIAELTARLDKAGISAETGLKSIAT